MRSNIHLIPINAMGVLLILIIQLISLNWSGAATINKDLPCDFHDSINITDGLPSKNDSIEFNGIIFPKGQYAEMDYILVNGTEFVSVNSHFRGCPCNIKRCIRYCCSPEKVYDLKLGIKAIGERYECANNDKALNIMYDIRKENNEMENVNLNKEFSYVIAPSHKNYYLGGKWEIKYTGQVVNNGKWHNHQSYCLLKRFNNKTDDIKLDVLIWLEKLDDRIGTKNLTYAIAMIMSVPFIAATFLVYLFLPELRNLHGKCLLGYLSGLIVGYSFMAYVQLNGWQLVDSKFRKFVGLSTYYSLLSAFFWSNIIAYDLHRSFRTTRFRIHCERKRFVVYALYAYGSPFLLTLITAILDYTQPFPDYLLPGIGTQTLFLKPKKNGKLAPFLYFYMLICIIFSVNILLFVVTAFKIRQAQRDISKITSQEESARHQSHLNNERDNLILFMRLFIIMGISWIMEAITYLATDANNKDLNFFVVIIDVWNFLQGLVVFILFVMKRRVLSLIKKRYRDLRGKNGKLNGSFKTNSISTKTSHLDSQTSHDKTKYTPIK